MKLLRLFLALLVCFVALPLFVGGGYLLDLARWIGGVPAPRWHPFRVPP